MTDYGAATNAKIEEVVQACKLYGSRAIIALAGVPGTGKSYIASIAAQRVASDPLLVRETQFHQSYSYEEFIEGMRIDDQGAVAVFPGVFLEWNDLANDDPGRTYVLLVEELTRANLPSVLGELMTYLEHRDRPFTTVYSRRPVKVASNLVVLATYNPSDRTAIELDAALIRRLRVIQFLPSTEQLAEMLKELKPEVVAKLKVVFDACKKEFPDDYEHLMPFGHGIFAGVKAEQPDLHRLWVERIEYLLRRPLVEPHQFTDVIAKAYPWKDPAHSTA
jgi:5-methylcytosine-specific restriction endonuclease McrBC GTP-binding regulatory subunit McrB